MRFASLGSSCILFSIVLAVWIVPALNAPVEDIGDESNSVNKAIDHQQTKLCLDRSCSLVRWRQGHTLNGDDSSIERRTSSYTSSSSRGQASLWIIVLASAVSVKCLIA